jgi:hypothetical protein
MVVNRSSQSSQNLGPPAPHLASGYGQAVTGDLGASGVDVLDEAVRGRHVISQAVGIAMERFGLSSARAFDYLVQVSRSSQLRLGVVATEMVAHANERDDFGQHQ